MDLDNPAIPSTSKETDFLIVSVPTLCELYNDLDTTKRELRIMIDQVTKMAKWMQDCKRIRLRLKRKYLLLRRLNKKRCSSIAYQRFRNLVTEIKKERKMRIKLQVEVLCQSPHTVKTTVKRQKNYIYIYIILYICICLFF